jgi:hypothetical protein
MTDSTGSAGAGAGHPGWHTPENLAKAGEALKTVDPNTLPPFVQKILAFVVGILTGIGGDLNESGKYSKSQTAVVLGTTYTFTETVDGTADVKAVPS